MRSISTLQSHSEKRVAPILEVEKEKRFPINSPIEFLTVLPKVEKKNFFF